jgi:thymidine kinase
MAKLYFYYSAMNAGKSTVLLQSSYNYRERGMDTLLYVPSIDDRYGVGKITSRIGLSSDAHMMDPGFDIYADVERAARINNKLTCILIDEAQFLNKDQVMQLMRIVDELNIPVLCYGLRSDFMAEPFEGSKYLLALADNLVEVKTVCHCGRKAIMNMRVDDKGRKVTQGEQIAIGGNDMYVATCRKHFMSGDSGEGR